MTPMICDTGSVSNIYVMNPIPTSVYEWSTTNGHILGGNTGPSIFVDTPGVYIVNQYLQSGCALYASDTITIGSLSDCNVLANNLFDFRSTLNNNVVQLNWKVLENQFVQYFEVERSTDGVNFNTLYRADPQVARTGIVSYGYIDNISNITGDNIFYRIRLYQAGSQVKLSNIAKHQLSESVQHNIRVIPNPVRDNMQVQINSQTDGKASILIYNQVGEIITTTTVTVQKGSNSISLDVMKGKPGGVYHAVISLGGKIFTEKIVVIK